MVDDKYLHRNGIKTRELLRVNLLTQYLKYFCISTFSFEVVLIVLTHKHVMPFNWKNIPPKDVNMWQIKIQFSISGL